MNIQKLTTASTFSLLMTFILVMSPLMVTAKEPGWSGWVVVPRAKKHVLKETPIPQRPYRPLHFYGNSIRRAHYRGNPLPLPRDLVRTGAQLVNPEVRPVK